MSSNMLGYGETLPKTDDGRKRDEKSFRSALPQILSTIVKNLILISFGMTLGFPTILIPALSDVNTDPSLRLSKEEMSWFGSIEHMAVPMGCLISGAVTQPFGRKRSMQALTIPFVITWLMFYFSQSVAMLFAGLSISGLTGGLMEAPVHTYVAEITQPHVRGFLSATSSLCVIIGIFTQFLMSNFVDWRTMSLINAGAPILAFIALFFIPESPHWLIGVGRVDDAEKSLSCLRGWRRRSFVNFELTNLVLSLRPDLHLKNSNEKSNDDANDRKKKCCTFEIRNYMKATFYKPCLLISLIFFIGHFSGMTTLTTYAVSIFVSFGSPIDKYVATMILGIVQMLATLFCVVTIHYLGKRKIAFITTIGSTIFFGGIGFYAYFYLGLTNLDQGSFIRSHFDDGMSGLAWLPLIALILGAFFAYMGLRLLPWILIGEVFPHETRGFASGVCAAVGYIFGFASNKTFYFLIDNLTLPGVYMAYGCITLIGCISLYFCLPETEGWTLLEIQEHFGGYRNLVKAGRNTGSNNTTNGAHVEMSHL